MCSSSFSLGFEVTVKIFILIEAFVYFFFVIGTNIPINDVVKLIRVIVVKTEVGFTRRTTERSTEI